MAWDFVILASVFLICVTAIVITRFVLQYKNDKNK